MTTLLYILALLTVAFLIRVLFILRAHDKEEKRRGEPRERVIFVDGRNIWGKKK